MATLEMPAMASHSYDSHTLNPADIRAGSYHFGGGAVGGIVEPSATGLDAAVARATRRPLLAANAMVAAHLNQIVHGEEEEPMLRYVQVFLVDPDENIPLDKRLLHKSEPFLTDDDDQSLFFGLNVTDLLKKHNEYRVTVQNKKVKDRSEPLEPARIKDLKMTVVNIAAFK